MHLAIANLRAGTGKTTTAVHLAGRLAETGRTLLVDSDPSRSALAWSELSGQGRFQVLGLPTHDIHRRLPGIARDFAHVVIDTPPGGPDIISSSVLAAGRVVVPTTPAVEDLAELAPTLDLVRRVAALWPARASVLLVRVLERPDRLRARRVLRAAGTADLMRAHVPLLEGAGLSFGLSGPARAYRPVAAELLGADASASTAPEDPSGEPGSRPILVRGGVAGRTAAPVPWPGAGGLL